MLGAHLTSTEGLLVNIPHLGFTTPYQITLYQQTDQFTGSTGIDRIDPGVDFHPGRHTQNQLTLPRTVADIARSAVATGEQQQINTGLLQFNSQPLGIRSTGLSTAQVTDHLMHKAQLSQQIGAHATGRSEYLQTFTQGQQHLKGLSDPLLRLRHHTHGQCLCGDTIRAFKRGLATQPGQGIDQ